MDIDRADQSDQTDLARDQLLSALPTLLRELTQSGVSEIEVTVGSASLYLRQQLNAVPQPALTVPSENGAPQVGAPDAGLVAVTAPLSGVFYAAPSPDDSPYVMKGDVVEPGQVVALVEAMKVFNEIHAEAAGVVEEILVSPGQQVKSGQTLMTIRPDPEAAPPSP
ncbi:MAG TPA: acetyl-CoA carboxylase [Chloroflexota bacterium]|jgi:acetyl-CoA carboxylase biotin carboxyl carrier protein|nr:acetyl-CoA carboxylase [Chloroflexota bacterium]